MIDEDLEAKLNAPDLEEQPDGKFVRDVEHYPLPSGNNIKDDLLRESWQEAVRLIERGEPLDEEE